MARANRCTHTDDRRATAIPLAATLERPVPIWEGCATGTYTIYQAPFTRGPILLRTVAGNCGGPVTCRDSAHARRDACHSHTPGGSRAASSGQGPRYLRVR